VGRGFGGYVGVGGVERWGCLWGGGGWGQNQPTNPRTTIQPHPTHPPPTRPSRRCGRRRTAGRTSTTSRSRRTLTGRAPTTTGARLGGGVGVGGVGRGVVHANASAANATAWGCGLLCSLAVHVVLSAREHTAIATQCRRPHQHQCRQGGDVQRRRRAGHARPLQRRTKGARLPHHPARAGRELLPQLRDPGAGRADHQPGCRELMCALLFGCFSGVGAGVLAPLSLVCCSPLPSLPRKPSSYQLQTPTPPTFPLNPNLPPTHAHTHPTAQPPWPRRCAP